MDAFTRTTRLVLLGFFGSHILFTLFLDGQAVIPLSWFPQFLLDLGAFEVETFNDPLMGNARQLLWFQSFVVLEITFQLPFFVWAVRLLGDASRTRYPDSFRAACIAYGAHTSTTLVPILACFWDPQHEATTLERACITALYFPYLAIPFWVLCVAALGGSGTGDGKKTR